MSRNPSLWWRKVEHITRRSWTASLGTRAEILGRERSKEIDRCLRSVLRKYKLPALIHNGRKPR